MPVERVGAQIFSALRTGRDATTPGLWNKVYLHGISKVLPVPVLAALHQVGTKTHLCTVYIWPDICRVLKC